jgi:hypothetical protein
MVGFLTYLLALPACQSKPVVSPSGDHSSGNQTHLADEAKPVVAQYMTLEEFHPAGEAELISAFPIEGALLVVSKDERVGRVVGEKVEWLKKRIPPVTEGAGNNHVVNVLGKWPEAVNVIYHTDNGRAPMPTFFPLVGNDEPIAFGGGGGVDGLLYGIARVGESTIAAYRSMDVGGNILTTFHGPKLERHFTTAKDAKCKDTERQDALQSVPSTAFWVHGLGGTKSGWMVSIGKLCDTRGGVAEVWDPTGKSKLVDLSTWLEGAAYGAQLLRGKTGNELFVFNGDGDLILRFKDGSFFPLPKLGSNIKKIFVSAEGDLHAYNGKSIFQLKKDKWVPIVHLTWPLEVENFHKKGEDIWVSTGGVFRLRPGTSTELTASCKTPFVYLSKVRDQTDRTFTFPEIRKALSSFSDVGQIHLIEYKQFGQWQLGLTVSTKAQGEAAIAHMKTTLKEEKPTLLCYAPKNPRDIPIVTKAP